MERGAAPRKGVVVGSDSDGFPVKTARFEPLLCLRTCARRGAPRGRLPCASVRRARRRVVCGPAARRHVRCAGRAGPWFGPGAARRRALLRCSVRADDTPMMVAGAAGAAVTPRCACKPLLESKYACKSTILLAVFSRTVQYINSELYTFSTWLISCGHNELSRVTREGIVLVSLERLWDHDRRQRAALGKGAGPDLRHRGWDHDR